MQKLITLTIDISSLQAQSAGLFSVSEIDAVGEMLTAGWGIESWEFVTGEEEHTKAVVMLLLNDGMDGVAYEDEFYELGEPEYLEDEEQDGDDEDDADRTATQTEDYSDDERKDS